MGLTYDGTGRVVSLAEAMQMEGSPLSDRPSRAASNDASAWIKDNNPSWYAGDGLVDMKIENAEMPKGERSCMVDNSVPETSGDGSWRVRNLGL